MSFWTLVVHHVFLDIDYPSCLSGHWLSIMSFWTQIVHHVFLDTDCPSCLSGHRLSIMSFWTQVVHHVFLDIDCPSCLNSGHRLSIMTFLISWFVHYVFWGMDCRMKFYLTVIQTLTSSLNWNELNALKI